MSKLPQEWQSKPHYELMVGWFSREPKARRILGEEVMSEPSRDYPGWYFWFRADGHRLYDSLEQAITAGKTILKNWQMESQMVRARAPLTLSKEERKNLVVELLGYPVPDSTPQFEPDSDQEQPELVKLFWEFGEYALNLSIWYSPLRDEFSTTFGSANNPLRSLEGSICTLQAASQADLQHETEDEDFEAEWKEVAVGPVSLEDDRLTVGFWSHTFDPQSPVIGVAYEEASFEDETMSYFLSKGAPDDQRTRQNL